MTPAERIAQLQDRAPAIPRLHIQGYNWWNEGLHGIARNGYATVFPQAIGLAATFDPTLMQAIGDVVSTEARAKFNPHSQSDSARYAGLTIWSPNINIFRDPRWGRGQETYGEDPYLTGTLGSSFVRGIQGDAPFYRKADATPKHFAVHSGPESIRDGFNSIASKHDLEDTYLPAFRKLAAAGADAMMCSYNAINGTPSCANPEFLQDRIRSQWGFNGYIVSDCDAIDEVTEYLHYTPDHAHGAAASLKAGVDLDCGSTYSHLNESLAQGLISTSDIDRALHRLLLARMKLGMLQPASCSPYASIPATEIDTPAHRQLALRAAEESMVLLRNDTLPSGQPLLPLDLHPKRIAVIGPSAALLSVIEANYHGTARNPQTLIEGLRQYLPKDAEITYAQGATLAQGVAVPVPPTAFSGLQGEYFSNAGLSSKPTLTRQDQSIDFDFDHISPADNTVNAEPSKPYSVRWTGALTPPAPGTYKLRIAIDRCFDCTGHDGYRLWLDGKLLLNDDGSKDNIPDSVTLQFQDTAPHPIHLELIHTGEDQGIHLEWEAPAEAQLAEGLAAARDADLILALIGLSPELEGEALRIKIPGFNGGDREDLNLPKSQRNLIAALATLGKPMILGVTSGSPVATADVTAGIHSPLALMQLWYPGEEGGHALANLLTGRAVPSGRLPVTIYRSAKDLPAFTDYSMAHRTYRYFTGPVEFPFGFGLSYTRFQYSETKFNGYRVSATVTNTGSVAAEEVVELYLVPSSVTEEREAPQLTLRGIQRIKLEPGQSMPVEFPIGLDHEGNIIDSNGNWTPLKHGFHFVICGAQPVPVTSGPIADLSLGAKQTQDSQSRSH
jgi:beta-glucosidase